ncbi:nucleotidyltransferase domain-containing protein [Methylomonas rapida]|uniref:Nucleotidyltransferase domain-containing protein n=1 Tax=Methylomonas rapida TaxID=2963939 RepID=A0ABY7GQ14_9GAMM|nr:nucleotidyltransferase domain-containing protein [Methylomonas rapida]WAR46591.1 nucleotidyltransferase domain-containing protein [Methylomonas rapida]
MRLTPSYRETIKEVAKNVFGDNVSVWLFGSRLDATAKGGDVDLLIKLESSMSDKALLAARYNPKSGVF